MSGKEWVKRVNKEKNSCGDSVCAAASQCCKPENSVKQHYSQTTSIIVRQWHLTAS